MKGLPELVQTEDPDTSLVQVSMCMLCYILMYYSIAFSITTYAGCVADHWSLVMDTYRSSRTACLTSCMNALKHSFESSYII